MAWTLVLRLVMTVVTAHPWRVRVPGRPEMARAAFNALSARVCSPSRRICGVTCAPFMAAHSSGASSATYAVRAGGADFSLANAPRRAQASYSHLRCLLCPQASGSLGQMTCAATCWSTPPPPCAGPTRARTLVATRHLHVLQTFGAMSAARTRARRLRRAIVGHRTTAGRPAPDHRRQLPARLLVASSEPPEHPSAWLSPHTRPTKRRHRHRRRRRAHSRAPASDRGAELPAASSRSPVWAKRPSPTAVAPVIRTATVAAAVTSTWATPGSRAQPCAHGTSCFVPWHWHACG